MKLNKTFMCKWKRAEIGTNRDIQNVLLISHIGSAYCTYCNTESLKTLMPTSMIVHKKFHLGGLKLEHTWLLDKEGFSPMNIQKHKKVRAGLQCRFTCICISDDFSSEIFFNSIFFSNSLALIRMQHNTECHFTAASHCELIVVPCHCRLWLSHCPLLRELSDQ